MIGISGTMMWDLNEEVPDIKLAVERGRARAVAEATEKYMRNFVMNNEAQYQPKAIEFFLERKGGWNKSPETAIQINNGPQPLSISDDDLDKLLEQ